MLTDIEDGQGLDLGLDSQPEPELSQHDELDPITESNTSSTSLIKASASSPGLALVLSPETELQKLDKSSGRHHVKPVAIRIKPIIT